MNTKKCLKIIKEKYDIDYLSVHYHSQVEGDGVVIVKTTQKEDGTIETRAGNCFRELFVDAFSTLRKAKQISEFLGLTYVISSRVLTVKLNNDGSKRNG